RRPCPRAGGEPILGFGSGARAGPGGGHPPRARGRARAARDARLRGMSVRILDVTDQAGFDRIPPCADQRFDHRTCDYWEDEVRGSKAARLAWLQANAAPEPPPRPSNPFAPADTTPQFNPFDPRAAAGRGKGFDPFAADD